MARRNLVCILTLAMMVLPVCSGPAVGDGVTLGHAQTDAYSHWGLIAENTQFALISHSQGVENLIISIRVAKSQLVGTDPHAPMYYNDAVWVYPVPANPRNVSIGAVGAVEPLSGSFLETKVESALSGSIDATLWSQVYPFMFALLLPIKITEHPHSSPPPKTWHPDLFPTFRVFQTFQGYGLTTELIGTNSSSGLSDYLASLQLSFPEATSSAVGKYIGEDYSLVVSRISNMTEFLDSAPTDVFYPYDNSHVYYNVGIAMRFPCDHIFYPMRLTSSYGDAEVPMLIQVLGFVSPYSSAGRMHVHTSYMVGTSGTIDPFVADFLRSSYQTNGVEYTELEFDSKASLLTDDLWMDSSQPSSVGVLKFTIDNPWAIALPIFMLGSVLSSLVATLVVFRVNKPLYGRAAMLGLLNITTIVGLGLATSYVLDRRLIFRDPQYPLPEHPVAGYLICFTAVFVVAVVALYFGFFALL
jgi:hypothetical protein